jgi:hypothetical protein
MLLSSLIVLPTAALIGGVAAIIKAIKNAFKKVTQPPEVPAQPKEEDLVVAVYVEEPAPAEKPSSIEGYELREVVGL